MIKVPDECFREYGADLDGCSTQEREGCGSCVLAKHVTPNEELIQQARELCEKRLTGINKYHGSIATKSSRCGDGVYDSIIERLYHFEYDIVPQLCDALVATTARAEAAEAERDRAIKQMCRFCKSLDKKAGIKPVCAADCEWRGPQETGKGEAE